MHVGEADARARAAERGVRQRRAIPTPSSLTSAPTSAAEVAADDLHAAGPRLLSTPWRTAFSTSGCSDRTGRTAGSTSGATSRRTLEPVAETRLLEPQVLLDVVQLVGERHVRALAGTRSG